MLTVCSFRARVIEPFKEVQLNDLPDEEFLGQHMDPNCNCPVPNYGMKDHTVFVCTSFFTDTKTKADYDTGW